MELFAHIGLTFGATALIDRFMPPRRSAAGAKAPTGWGVFRGQKVDFRLVMVGSLLPDIIDKPLGSYRLPLGNGRVYAHTLLFLLAMITLGILSFRWRKGLVVPTLAFGTLCHLLLDSMWAHPRTLFWPLLGPFEKVMPRGG